MTSLTAPIAPGESIIAPRTDSSASRFCGGTGAVGEAWASWAIGRYPTTLAAVAEGLDDPSFDRPPDARSVRFAGTRERMFPEPPDGACGQFSRSQREFPAQFHRPCATCGEGCALLLLLRLWPGFCLGGGLFFRLCLRLRFFLGRDRFD